MMLTSKKNWSPFPWSIYNGLSSWMSIFSSRRMMVVISTSLLIGSLATLKDQARTPSLLQLAISNPQNQTCLSSLFSIFLVTNGRNIKTSCVSFLWGIQARCVSPSLCWALPPAPLLLYLMLPSMQQPSQINNLLTLWPSCSSSVTVLHPVQDTVLPDVPNFLWVVYLKLTIHIGRGFGPKVSAIYSFFSGRPNFLKPSKLRKKQTDDEQREALLLTTQ
jgi:hypothetical protein